MASLVTHFCASLFLLPIGLRRLFCSSSLYLKNPSLFRSKTWYLSDPKWINLDLYALTVALPIASFSLIFLFFSISTGHVTYRFSFLHQSLLLFLYWVLAILFVLRDSIGPLVILDNFLFVFGGVLFFVEWSLIGEGTSGLVGEAVYGLSGNLSLVCGLCCLYLAIRPGAFFAEYCLCCGLVLKGTWFLQAGLCLYTDVFGLKGCHKIEIFPGSGNVEFKCDLEEDGLRGVALVNLLFVGHAIVVFLVSLGMLALLSSNRNLRHGEASGPLLAGLESESALMRTLPEFEVE
ncbi:PROTEIN putative-RELATED [Salix koriyanagi]|uniref:PROTEIN putative-RELATED n=1 Tax=Salix koriyanagi TaxID=2511006 RepID=A0A9Q1AFG5_9ROSI|nr:PROTEIN putative-RELATED [Salix koriyanagi]